MADRTGRPRKDGDEREKAVLALLRAGNTREAAASGAGIHPATLRRYMAGSARFRAAVEAAEHEAEVFFADRIRKAAREAEITEHYDARGNLLRRVIKYDWKAAAWWLERRRAQNWKPAAKVEVTGADGGPIATETRRVVVFEPSPEWLDGLAQAMRELPPDARQLLLGPGAADEAQPVQPAHPDTAPSGIPRAARRS